MLKPLATLIKISRAQLDEKRKELAVLLNKKQSLIDEIKMMEESIVSEAENLDKLQAEFRPTFLMYLEATRIREGQILQEIDKMNPAINKVSDEIAILFAEAKKYEIVKENRENEIELELQRRTQMEIDEIAIMSHTRRSADEYL